MCKVEELQYLSELDSHISKLFTDDNYCHHYGGSKERNNINNKLKLIYDYIGDDLYHQLWLNLCKERKKIH